MARGLARRPRARARTLHLGPPRRTVDDLVAHLRVLEIRAVDRSQRDAALSRRALRALVSAACAAHGTAGLRPRRLRVRGWVWSPRQKMGTRGEIDLNEVLEMMSTIWALDHALHIASKR